MSSPASQQSSVPEEKILIQMLKAPESRERAFEKMMISYQKPLYWHIRRMVGEHDDADDLLQNTFIKAWKNLDKFRGDSKIKTWLFRIATNETLTFLNRRKKRNYGELADLEDNLAHSSSSSGYMEGEEIKAKLMAAVDTLPEKQKLVFQLKYFEEMKYDEIVEVVGGTVGSLKASFHHAVKKIELFLTTS